MKLGKMMIFVSDLAAAKNFYVEILGFPMLAETADRLDLEHDGCDLVLFRCGKDSVIEGYGNAARSVFVFEVASINETMAHLRNHGIKFIHETPAENDFSRYAAFSDPFGNVHEIFERK